MAEQQQPNFRVQDNASIVETYANKFLGSYFDGGGVCLTVGGIAVALGLNPFKGADHRD
jgi:hypothetical protein